jgi:predicted nucleotidyltransferase
VSRARTVIELHLGAMLEAIHLFGSALAGGPKPHSDIDSRVIVTSARRICSTSANARSADSLSAAGQSRTVATTKTHYYRAFESDASAVGATLVKARQHSVGIGPVAS